MELFTLLGIIWACMILWEIIKARSVISNRMDEIRDKVDKTVRIVSLEQLPEQGNLILAYDAENNQFLGQGVNIDEIRNNIMSRFPERIFLLNEQAFSARPDFKVKQ